MTGARDREQSVMRTALALIATGVLASCVGGEHQKTAVVVPEANAREAVRLLNARCTVCHSTDLIRQQRLNGSQWRAEVHKMVGWGAQLSDAEQELLVAYLSARYHPEAPEVIAEDNQHDEQAQPASVGHGSVVLVGHAPRGAPVYAHNCLPCHGEGAAGGVGPKLAGNPILDRDEAFQETVMRGRGAMPAWGAILKPQEIADVHAWLKSLR